MRPSTTAIEQVFINDNNSSRTTKEKWDHNTPTSKYVCIHIELHLKHKDNNELSASMDKCDILPN